MKRFTGIDMEKLEIPNCGLSPVTLSYCSGMSTVSVTRQHSLLNITLRCLWIQIKENFKLIFQPKLWFLFEPISTKRGYGIRVEDLDGVIEFLQEVRDTNTRLNNI